MNMPKNRGKVFFANQMHRNLFFLVFFASLVPTIVTAIFLFYLIFNITADQVGIPESIAYNIIPAAQRVIGALSVATPLIIFGILIFTYKTTHKIVGPFDRILRELDECIAGTREGPIMLRKNDKFWPLVAKINILLSKNKKNRV